MTVHWSRTNYWYPWKTRMAILCSLMSLFPFICSGAAYISEEVEMASGDYILTKFMVINPAGEVILATPVEGSPLAYLVDDPLPISFSIVAGTATMIAPELLSVGNYDPGDFGYISFGGQIIKPLGFFVMAVLDNPLSMSPIQLSHIR